MIINNMATTSLKRITSHCHEKISNLWYQPLPDSLVYNGATLFLDGGGGRVQLDKSRDVVYFNSLDVISNNIFSDSTFRSCLHRQEYLLTG